MPSPGPIRRVAVQMAGLVIALVAAGCGGLPDPGDGPTPLGVRVEDKGFVLQMSLPSSVWASADDIPVSTTLTWTGPAPEGGIWSSGGGPVVFTFTEVGGKSRMMGGAMTADCAAFTYARGVPAVIPLRKSGGWVGEDPNASFYEAWYAEAGLHLPVGNWRLQAVASGFLAPCAADAPSLDLKTAALDLIIR
jgi:hypothetical protein